MKRPKRLTRLKSVLKKFLGSPHENHLDFEFVKVDADLDFFDFYESKFTRANSTFNQVRQSNTAAMRDYLTNTLLSLRFTGVKTQIKCVFIGISHNVLVKSLLEANEQIKSKSKIWLVDKFDTQLLDGSSKDVNQMLDFCKSNANIQCVLENIPRALDSICGEIHFFHLDTVNPAAEIISLPDIFSKLAPQGMIILDTFFPNSSSSEKEELIRILNKEQLQFYILPTLQIVISKDSILNG
jgi:hypothetical protein